MNELTHRKITLHKLIYFWIQPGDAVHDDRQRSDIFGYFPTPELADTHAEAMNLGYKLSAEQMKPPDTFPFTKGAIRRVRSAEGHQPPARKIVGYYVAPTEGFTSDEGKTFEIAGHAINVEKSILHHRIEDDHQSMEYRRYLGSLKPAP
jgi:hypothetical protein